MDFYFPALSFAPLFAFGLLAVGWLGNFVKSAFAFSLWGFLHTFIVSGFDILKTYQAGDTELASTMLAQTSLAALMAFGSGLLIGLAATLIYKVLRRITGSPAD